MKYWFFAALLANVVFLLWEFHYGAFDQAESPNAVPENAEKQILTVSEAAGRSTSLAELEAQTVESAENLAGLQEQQPARPEEPHVPPAGGETATLSVQPEIVSQAAIPAETPEVSANAADAKQETGTAAESAAPSAISAEKEQATTAPVLPSTSEVSEAAGQPSATPAEQQPINAPAEPAAPEEKETAAVTVSPAIPEAIDIPPQAPAAQTEQAETKREGETAVSSESATPQTELSAAENPAPAIPEQTPIAAQPQTAPAPVEVNSADSAAQQPPVVPEAPKPEVLKTECYTAGPVEDAAALEALLNRYRPQLKDVGFSASEKRKNNTYLVYYPAAATLEQSIAAAEMLRSHYGISDLLVFREGDLKGMISLGVFSNEQRAKTAQSQFEAKGVHAEIRPRFPLEVHYAVRMSWNEPQAETAQQLADALKSRYRARRATSACK